MLLIFSISRLDSTSEGFKVAERMLGNPKMVLCGVPDAGHESRGLDLGVTELRLIPNHKARTSVCVSRRGGRGFSGSQDLGVGRGQA